MLVWFLPRIQTRSVPAAVAPEEERAEGEAARVEPEGLGARAEDEAAPEGLGARAEDEAAPGAQGEREELVRAVGKAALVGPEARPVAALVAVPVAVAEVIQQVTTIPIP